MIHLAADPVYAAETPVHRRARRARRRHAPLRPGRRRRPRRPARRTAAAGRDRHRRRPADLVASARVIVRRRARPAVRRRGLVGRVDPRGAACASTRSTSPRRSRSSTRPPTRVSRYSQLWADACRVAAFLGEHGVWPGDVVSVQLPNWYETVAVDLGVLARGAVLNPLLPNYRARELAPHPRHRAHEAAVHARRVPRLRPRRARSRPPRRRSTRSHDHVVVRGAGDFWQHVLGRAPRAPRARRRIPPRSPR